MQRYALEPPESGLFDAEAWKAPKDRRQCDLAFDPSKRGAETKMDAVPEGQVAVRHPSDIEPVGLGELGGIAVRRAKHGPDSLARSDDSAVELDLQFGDTRDALDWTVVAKQFLNGGLDQAWIIQEPLPLLGMAGQRPQPVADKAGGRLMTGLQHEDAHAEELGLCDLVLALLEMQE